ncbi:helix-turn-helix transcriptional regulator [Microbacterium aurugineum]|uniref:helix-turn-helix transcriptional regulator n=1 Tax=Microbacterium aurugineum TaxID=2851642 RepID=UPI0020BFD529|nr:WYL domain-containing protein [Microbacterium aurugineum]MCK8475858.1 WYL domain-containing protein [Microbacterium aurugineum]
MRADRLVSLLLLLRQRGRMTADQLAGELEVSVRTVLRDIDALSSAGVPVYVDRGRHGGYSLLPGFRTELTGLNHDEALALFTAGSVRAEKVFGLSAPLAAAMRKVVDALPAGQQASLGDAARRLLVEPEADLLSRRQEVEAVADGVMSEVRRAVLTGHRLRFSYQAPAGAPSSRTVDPIGLVTVRGHTYLIATRSGKDRTYRLSRMATAEVLPDPAQRSARVDLGRMWAERTAQFLADGHLEVSVRVKRSRRDELLSTARAVRSEDSDVNGWARLELTYDDLRHATWALWQLGADAEVMSPEVVRQALRERASALVVRYESPGPAENVAVP